MKKKAAKKSPRKPVKGSMTLDVLGTMVANGFSEVRSEFKEVHEEIDRLDSRIDNVDNKLTAIHGEVLSMHFDYKKLIARIENVEVRLFGSVQE